MGYFADTWNPQPEEIRAWAFDAEALEPDQDFDLALSWRGHEKAYLEMASDPSCPKRLYFLSILYLMVGDAVRNAYRSQPKPIVQGFVQRGDDYHHRDIALWQKRSRALMDDPSLFDYDLWCAGGFLREDA